VYLSNYYIIIIYNESNEKEIENEKNLSFDSKDYLLKLIKEVDLKQRVNFKVNTIVYRSIRILCISRLFRGKTKIS
jgi:hypothetical protein